MITKFLNGVITGLHTEFGDGYQYRIEDTEQNFKKPAFRVDILNPTIRSNHPKKYERTFPLVIHYFTDKPETNSANKDCYAVAERIMDAIEYITVDSSLFRGEEISFELVEGVLQFFITYSTEVIKQEELVMMEDGTYNDVPMI